MIDIKVFFFSSRRRHTRSTRDWSSDVCSSDLELHDGMQIGRTSCSTFLANTFRVLLTAAAYVLMQELRLHRSEERRVGKECRSRWSPSQSTKEARLTRLINRARLCSRATHMCE